MSGKITRTFPAATCSLGSSSCKKIKDCQEEMVIFSILLDVTEEKRNYIFGEEFIDPVVGASIGILTKNSDSMVLFLPLFCNITTINVGASST